LGSSQVNNRLGDNITGVSFTTVAKLVEALHEVAPPATVIGCLLNPDNPTTKVWTREAQEASARWAETRSVACPQ
jgi:ABC-type uncharacterized transport system substrate-binding protein